MDLKAIATVLLVVSIWGINFSFIKIGLKELPPLLFSALRFSIVAFPALFFIPFPKGELRNVLSVGFFLGVIKFGLLFIGLDGHISAGISALILQAQVIFTLALSAVFFKEPLSREHILGVVIAVFGFSFFFQSTSGNATLLGIFLILLAALSWSIANMSMKSMKTARLFPFMVWSCAIPPLPLFGLSYLLETQEPMRVITSTTPTTWLALAFVSYLSTLVAFALWGHLLRSHRAALVTPFALLIPVVGIGASAVLLGEHLSHLEYVGSGIVLLGLVICVFGKKLTRIFGADRKSTR